jgi:hypothetical protein
MLPFGDPGPLSRWFWLTVVAVVAGILVLMVLGVSETILNVVLAVGLIVWLIFIAPRVLRRLGGSDALGKPRPRDP